MKLRALRGFCIGNGRDVAPGDEFDVRDEFQASYWLGLGVAEKVVIEDTPEAPADGTTAPARVGRGANRKGR